MYKYFSELENLSNFKTYLLREPFDKNQDCSIREIPFSIDFLKQLETLFPKLNKIDKLIIALDENLILKTPKYNLFPYESLLDCGHFFQNRDENYCQTQYDLKENIKLTSWDLHLLLDEMLLYIPYLTSFYPDYQDFLLNAQKEIQKSLVTLNLKSTIKNPSKSDSKMLIWPDAWYITPSGYLYNTGFGHTQGNLKYQLYMVIYESLKQNKKIPNINNSQHIADILKRGYITYNEFEHYSHLMYKLPTVITPEVEHDRECYKNMLKLSKKEIEKLIHSSKINWPHPERSYQKNLITLIIGHLAAESSLYSSFSRINESSHKKEIIEKLQNLTANDIRDVFVRFCGFHKIESIIDKTITTSSLNGITEFSEYLKKGWNLHIVPKIIYDKYNDELSQLDFNSYFVNKHLDNELAKYEGNGKILIKI